MWSLVSGVSQPSVHTVWSLVSGGVSQAVAATTEQLREAFKARFILEISFSQRPLDPVVYGPVEVRCITGRAWWSRHAYVTVTRKSREMLPWLGQGLFSEQDLPSDRSPQ